MTEKKTRFDFYEIETRPGQGKGNKVEVYPEYKVCRSKDLVIRGGNFYVVYDESTKLWTEDKVIIQEAIDSDIQKKINEKEKEQADSPRESYIKYVGKFLGNFSSTHWTKFDQYVKSLPDTKNFILDQEVTFLGGIKADGEEIKKADRVSKMLPYSLPISVTREDYSAWDEMMDILYEPEEREKIEWAIGAILCGDAKKIQKFLVFYGPQGSGKSTVLNIVMKLLKGYYATFKAESLVSSNDQFGCKFLSTNPLVAIDEDTNLSRIETNATINKIASHEELEVNEKYKSQYVVKPLCMMMLGTNKPVRITDAKSGIIRRLIDIEPSGRKIKPIRKYEAMNRQIEMQLGAIARHCMDVYLDDDRGMHYYDDYIPERMMYRTDPFFNFMQEHFEEYRKEKYVLASNLWAQWKDYCQDSGIEFTRKRFEIIDEAKNYFREYATTQTHVDGEAVRARFIGLKTEKFLLDKQPEKKMKEPEEKFEVEEPIEKPVEKPVEKHAEVKEEKKSDISESWLKFDCTKSLLDDLLADCNAQYDTGDKVYPLKYSWDKCKTKLKDLDTTKTHFVQGFSEKLITADFDKKGPDGKKDLQANIEAASKWPPTYAELSNSGAAIHLEYWYDGDPNDLSSVYDLDNDVEIKVYPNDKLLSLRRRLSKCNDLPIAHISSGLPLKEKKNMVNWEGLKNDKHLRNTIEKIIRKEIDVYGASPKTITCMKSIRDVLDQAKSQNISYDLRDLDGLIEAFAMHSHNNSKECMDIYYSLDLMWPKEPEASSPISVFDKKKEDSKPIIILDCEVVRNLTLVVYKELEPDGKAAIFKKPEDRLKKCVRMYNPSPTEIAELLDSTRMIGHNVIRYDNYILYALMLGKSSEEIAELSQRIIKSSGDEFKIPYGWHVAKQLSYADTWDAANGDNRRGLKKIEIEMCIPHKEMEIDWEKPLPESEWERLALYCENDVLADEAYYLSKEFQVDFKARKILAALTGMTVNDTTNNLTAQLIFGDEKDPQKDFVYPDLHKMFPEYRFVNGKSYYGDELIGEGGRVYAQWGVYYDVVTFDVASMHPTSIIVEQGFGPYTKNYEDLYKARIAIKHGDYEAAKKMFDGRLAPYLDHPEDADALGYALKIALNSVYGMTSAGFKNRFKDPRNVDNWVAKRGALFMEKLRREVQARGGKVVHIKTDSIKLEKPTKELSDFVLDFGKQYGYTFEIESHYERMCLVNNAVYIALRAKDDPSWLKECKKAKERAEKTETPYIEPTRWTATGAQFAQPYVFKRMFSHEPLDFDDFCEIKHVKTALYLDLNENLPDVTQAEKEKAKIKTRIRKLQKDLLKPELSDLNKEKIQGELEDRPKDIEVLDEEIAKGHNYVFVGGTGEFMPIVPGAGGGLLMRKGSDDSYGYAPNAKGYRWLESESMRNLPDWKKYIDIRYFRGLVDDAREAIGVYCDPELFIRGEDGIILPEEQIVEYDVDPWMHPCKTEKYAYCSDCPDFESNEQGQCICKQGYDISNQILGESKESITL